MRVEMGLVEVEDWDWGRRTRTCRYWRRELGEMVGAIVTWEQN